MRKHMQLFMQLKYGQTMYSNFWEIKKRP